MTARTSRPVHSALLGLLLTLASPRSARAEDAVRYKYQDYRESGGRIAVRVNGAVVEKDFGPDTHLKLEGVTDGIAGATPNGQPAPAMPNIGLPLVTYQGQMVLHMDGETIRLIAIPRAHTDAMTDETAKPTRFAPGTK